MSGQDLGTLLGQFRSVRAEGFMREREREREREKEGTENCKLFFRAI